MKAQLLTRFQIDGIELRDVPRPVPGPGQVLLRMKAWSLNYRDLLVARGIYMPNLQFPFSMLSDGVGEVVETGDGVDSPRVGERVATCFMQAWREGTPDAGKSASALGGNIAGIASEYVVLDASGVVSLPDHLTDEEGATLPCAALTAWQALVTAGHLAAGDTVLVQGTGGVSIFALQFARMMGARVIATSSSDDKLDRVRELGATDVLNYKSVQDWGPAVRKLTNGVGVDHVVEVGGAGTLGQSLEAVRTGGRISLIGVLTQGTFNPIPILMKSVVVQGIFVGSREMFEAMNRAISVAKLKPVIDRVFPFDAMPEALKYMEGGAHFGKIVLKI